MDGTRDRAKILSLAGIEPLDLMIDIPHSDRSTRTPSSSGMQTGPLLPQSDGRTLRELMDAEIDISAVIQ